MSSASSATFSWREEGEEVLPHQHLRRRARYPYSRTLLAAHHLL
jgi:hypothetical protein